MFELIGKDEDRRTAFKAFLTFVSENVFNDSPPITNTSEIKSGGPYQYLLDALTPQESGVCAFDDWIASQKAA